ncbi:hypothetical protein JW826_02900 [Candidatus Woesearchaeota archaeon]|nr:hypothetical protein [Candidatus Woesearchaeota archaeon]
MISKLSEFGLTQTEAKVYGSLIDHGKMQAGMISRKTGIHRRVVYDALERLIEKGLASWMKENEKRYYYAENPKKLREILDMKGEVLGEIMPALLAKYSAAHEKEETKFYKGREGIKTILQDQIETGKTIHIIGASYNAREILKYYINHYTRARVEKKLKLQLIYCGKRRDVSVPYGSVSYLPESYASPVSTNIYGNKVAIIVWSDEPVAVLIKNQSVSEAYKKYFDILWGIANKMKKRD